MGRRCLCLRGEEGQRKEKREEEEDKF